MQQERKQLTWKFTVVLYPETKWSRDSDQLHEGVKLRALDEFRVARQLAQSEHLVAGP